nr:Zgc:171897 protein [Danio rerio]
MQTDAAYVCLCFLIIQGLFGDADEFKSVLVTEGGSVPLYTYVTEVHDGDQILWKFGHQNTLIAEIMKRDQIGININFVVNDGIFKDKLQLDKHTGSLTIRNIRTEHTGLYELTVISGKTLVTRFNVTVYSLLPVPFINNNTSNCSSKSLRSHFSRCSVLCSVVNVSAVSLSWYKGNSVLSSISVSDLSISLSLPLEVEYQDKSTFSCVINNTITNHTTHLDINVLCHTCAELEVNHYLIPLIVAAVVLFITSVLGLFWSYRKCKQGQGES